MKTHPKPCKQFASDKCKFKNSCSYSHQEPRKIEEQSEMIEKVKQLEKVLHAMTRKVLSLEEEIMKIKKNTTKNKIVKELRNLKGVKEKAIK